MGYFQHIRKNRNVPLVWYSIGFNLNYLDRLGKMKKIRLIDVDNMDKPFKNWFPNIALMKLSAWHKQQGDQVSWVESNPDIVYASVVFTENRHKLYWLKLQFPNAEIHIGGSGVDLKLELPKEVDQMMPDYSLYKQKLSMGFLSRGCPNKCKFCIVGEKEGTKAVPYMRVEDFHDPKHKKVVFLDNNILALKDWFKENMEYVKEHNLTVDFNQGLDIRRIDKNIIKILKEIKTKELRFAWDSMDSSKQIKKKINLIEKEFDHMINVGHRVSFYVLVECDTNIIQDLERVHYLRSRNIASYIMPYQKIYKNQPEPIRQKHTKSLERYCNKRDEYWRYDNYWEYLKKYYSLPYYLKILNEWKKLGGKIEC